MKASDYHHETTLYIERLDEEYYLLEYINQNDEKWKYYATKEEILTELSEHMDNMNFISFIKEDK